MTYQPSDGRLKKRTNFVITGCSLFILILGVIPHDNDIEFHDIDESLQLLVYSQAGYICQADSSALIHSNSNDPSLPPTISSALNDVDEILNENFGPADESFLADAFPDAVLGESSLIDRPYGIFLYF
jgi:hypothetical protein